MAAQQPSGTDYGALRTELRRLLVRARAAKTADKELVRTYWTIGKRLVKSAVLDDASYGDAVLRHLAEDLDVDLRTLQRTVAFYSAYQAVPTSKLSWAHYRELVTVSDPEERLFYEKLAAEEHLSRDKLVTAIEADLFSGESGRGSRVRLSRPGELRYAFEGRLSRVVDGDTIDLELDLGFGVVKLQRLRFAGVDAMSAKSKLGRQATEYVMERLAVADRIVVQTRRVDLHGRYVAHIFYSTRSLGFLETFERGRHLNQELLDRKLAVRMRRGG